MVNIGELTDSSIEILLIFHLGAQTRVLLQSRLN